MSSRQGLQFGQAINLTGPNLTINATARERAFMADCAPNIFFTGGGWVTDGADKVLVDKVSGCKWRSRGDAHPVETTAINNRPSLLFAGQSILIPDQMCPEINTTEWSCFAVMDIQGGGTSSGFVTGGMFDGPQTAGTYAANIALSGGKRPALYAADEDLRANATAGSDVTTSGNLVVVTSSSDGIHFYFDGAAAGTDAADTNPLDDGRFVIGTNMTITGSVVASLYGNIAALGFISVDLSKAANAARMVALKTYVSGEFGLTIA